MRKLLLAAAALLGVASLAAAPKTDAPPAAKAARPSILLVTLDTTRADHTSAYGYERPTTPRLEKMAAEGVRFEAAYAPMATTLPSHVTMFSALLPLAHGTLKNGLPVAASFPVLAEVLAKGGYRTAAFVSSFAVDSGFGIDRGFATYDDDFTGGRCNWETKRWEGIKVEGEFCRRGDLTRVRVEGWLEENGYLARATGVAADAKSTATGAPATKPAADGETVSEAEPGADVEPPFFVWMHLFDPHSPYDPLPEHAALFPPRGGKPKPLDRQIAAYDAEIHFADQETGKLLDRLAAAGRLDDTLVVVVGDHGEGLMQHGWMMHGLQIYEEAVRVPLILRWPQGLPGGRTVSEPVEVADLMPTLLDLAGLAMPKLPRAPDGRSIAAAARGTASLDPEHTVRLQRRFYQSGSERGGIAVAGDKHAVRVGDWKYIEAKEEDSFELFDLSSDPGEQKNLARENPQKTAALAEVLRRWVASAPAAAAPRGVSAEDARRLEALGYVQ